MEKLCEALVLVGWLVELVDFQEPVCGLSAVGKAVELNKQRSPKHPSPPAEQTDAAAGRAGGAQPGGAQPGEGSDSSGQFSPSTTSPTHSTLTPQGSDTSGQDSDPSKIQSSLCWTFAHLLIQKITFSKKSCFL